MMKIQDYTFKNEDFRLEDIITWKTTMIEQLALSLDEFIFNDGALPSNPEEQRIITFLYALREKNAEIEQVICNLDKELQEMGFYQRNAKPETAQAVQ